MKNIMEYMKSETPAIQTTLSYRRMKSADLLVVISELIEEPRASEVTITFKECWRTAFNDDEIDKMLQRYFDALCETFGFDILLVREYGENHHLHYHGIIVGKAKDKSMVLSLFKRRFGRSTIKNIQYTESYKKYLMKEQEGEVDIIFYKHIY